MLLAAIGFTLLTGATGRADTVGRQFPLYVGDNVGGAVVKVDSSGNVTQFARIPGPESIAVAPNGDVYVTTDASQCCAASLYRLDSAGNATLLPNIVRPFALAFDDAGNLYAALQDQSVVRVDASGNPVPYGTGWLAGMAFGPDGHLYATRYTRDIYRMDDSGNLVLFTTLNTSSSFFGDGIAFDKAGNMYVGSGTNSVIMKVDTAGAQSVFANDGYIQGPWGMAADDNGALYIASARSGSIVKVTPDGTQSLFANNGIVAPIWIAFSRPALYVFSGFLAPVNSAPTVNTGKAGRTYPVTWNLKNQAGGNVSALSAVKSIGYQAVGCDAFDGGASDELIDAASTGGSGLRYDTTANQYVYNWASPAQSGCYTLTLTFDTNQAFQAYFKLK